MGGVISVLILAILASFALGEEDDQPPAQEKTQKFVRAAATGDVDELSQLLASGVDVNAKSKHGLTALQAARIGGYEQVTEFLITNGANTDTSFSPDEFVDSILSEAESPATPGIAVLVSRNGTVVFSKGWGMANLQHDVPVSTKTKFRIGSVTKQFTAAAILKLQEDGKLSVDDPLSKFIPDYPRGDEVKIHHLLTHTSGIHSFTSKPDFFATVASGTTPEEMIESFKDDPFDFSPSEKFQYNNSGYFLLGHIIAKVSEKPFGEYLQETFFDPLGMHDTGVHTATAILKHEATGYAYAKDGSKKAIDWDMSRAGAAGNLYSTVEDLNKWNEALFGGKLLGEESLRAAFTPVDVRDDRGKMPYGFGWIADEYRGLKRISHGGGLHGFLSYLLRFPDHNMTIAVLHNASPPVPEYMPNGVADRLAEAYLWEEMKPRPRFEVATDIDPQVYDDYVGRYEYGSGAVMTVTRDNDRLFAQLSGQAKHEIFPTSETKFFWKVVTAQVEFLRDDDGTLTSARHTQGGVTFEAPKMEEEETVKVAGDVLDLYVGKYSYKGLGVLTVRRQGDQLKAQMTGQPEFDIFPKSDNEFFWKVIRAEIKFVKDKDGSVKKAVHKQGGNTIEAKKIE